MTLPRWMRAVFVANLVAQIGIVFTGALVRVTASGLGCPTWPECVDGSLTPTSAQTEQWHKYIEFGNRTLTFILGALAIAAVVAGILAWKRTRRREIFLWSLVPIAGTVAQAVLGGITVLTGLNPLVVAAHFLLSLAIIVGVVVLVRKANDSAATPVPRLLNVSMWCEVAVVGAVAVLGTVVTGSGPHSGDAEAGRLELDPRLVSWLHADVVLLFLGLTIGLLVTMQLLRVTGAARGWLIAVLTIAIVQGVIGYTQYFTNLPWVLVSIHVLGAALLWTSVWFAALSLRPVRDGARQPLS